MTRDGAEPRAGRASAEAVAGPLLELLRGRLGPGVGYTTPPQRLGDGATARAFALRLAGAPADLAGDLVLRLLFGANGLAYRLVGRVDRGRLHDYSVFHGCRVLVRIAALRAAGAEQQRPPSPELMAWGSPRTLRLLARRICRITGLAIDPGRLGRALQGV